MSHFSDGVSILDNHNILSRTKRLLPEDLWPFVVLTAPSVGIE